MSEQDIKFFVPLEFDESIKTNPKCEIEPDIKQIFFNNEHPTYKTQTVIYVHNIDKSSFEILLNYIFHHFKYVNFTYSKIDVIVDSTCNYIQLDTNFNVNLIDVSKNEPIVNQLSQPLIASLKISHQTINPINIPYSLGFPEMCVSRETIFNLTNNDSSINPFFSNVRIRLLTGDWRSYGIGFKRHYAYNLANSENSDFLYQVESTALLCTESICKSNPEKASCSNGVNLLDKILDYKIKSVTHTIFGATSKVKAYVIYTATKYLYLYMHYLLVLMFYYNDVFKSSDEPYLFMLGSCRDVYDTSLARKSKEKQLAHAYKTRKQANQWQKCCFRYDLSKIYVQNMALLNRKTQNINPYNPNLMRYFEDYDFMAKMLNSDININLMSYKDCYTSLKKIMFQNSMVFENNLGKSIFFYYDIFAYHNESLIRETRFSNERWTDIFPQPYKKVQLTIGSDNYETYGYTTKHDHRFSMCATNYKDFITENCSRDDTEGIAQQAKKLKNKLGGAHACTESDYFISLNLMLGDFNKYEVDNIITYLGLYCFISVLIFSSLKIVISENFYSRLQTSVNVYYEYAKVSQSERTLIQKFIKKITIGETLESEENFIKLIHKFIEFIETATCDQLATLSIRDISIRVLGTELCTSIGFNDKPYVSRPINYVIFSCRKIILNECNSLFV
jgi:hypothetical protein